MNLISDFQITGPNGILPVKANTQVLNLNPVKAYLDFAFKPSLQIDDSVALGNYRFYIKQFPKAPNEFSLTDPDSGFVAMFNRFWPLRQYYEAFLLEGRIRIIAKNIGAKWELQADTEFPENALALPVLYGQGSSPDLADQNTNFILFERVSVNQADNFIANSIRNWLEPIRIYQTPKEKGLYITNGITFSEWLTPKHFPESGGINLTIGFCYRLNRLMGYLADDNLIQNVGEAQTIFIIPGARKEAIPIKLLPQQPFYSIWHNLPQRVFAPNKPFLTTCLVHKGDFTAFGPDGAVITVFKKTNFINGAIATDLLYEENIEDLALHYGPAIWFNSENYNQIESVEIDISSLGNSIEEGAESIKWVPIKEQGNWESFLFLNENGFWESLFLLEMNSPNEALFSTGWLDLNYFNFLKDASDSIYWRKWKLENNQWINTEIKVSTALVYSPSGSLACLEIRF